MNAICQFRKCTLDNEQLANEVERITDEMYFKTHEVPTRQIPARPDKDYDLLIGELLIRFREMMKAIQIIGRLRDRYSNKYTKTPSHDKDHYIQWLQDEYAELALKQANVDNSDSKALHKHGVSNNEVAVCDCTQGKGTDHDEEGREYCIDCGKYLKQTDC